MYALRSKHSTSWFGPYGSVEDAREAQHRIATHGDSLGVREATTIVRADYTAEGITLSPMVRRALGHELPADAHGARAFVR